MAAPTTAKLIGIIALGAVVIPIAALCRAYDGPVHDSIKPGHGKVDYWTWQWMNTWYANTEDGNGLWALMSDFKTRYADTFTFWSWVPQWARDAIIVTCWSAWRNNANNFKRPYRNDTWLPPGAKSVWPRT